jgi:hypothetical protein
MVITTFFEFTLKPRRQKQLKTTTKNKNNNQAENYIH